MRRGWQLANVLGGKVCLRRAAAFVVLGLECLLVWFSLTPGPGYPLHSRNESSTAAFSQQSLTLDFQASQNRLGLFSRTLFPYSVIPGGVENEKELKQAIANDPVVAAHYAGFNPAKSRIILVNRERAVYVSYRLDSHIYWTRRKLRLPKGESLITDGEITARTRCGNQISEVPLGPVSPAEPTMEALEQPEDPPLVAEVNPPFELPLAPPPATDIHPITHQGRIFIPPLVPILFGGPGSNPGIPVNPPPPTTPVPEPDTLLLILVGLSSVWMIRRKRKS